MNTLYFQASTTFQFFPNFSQILCLFVESKYIWKTAKNFWLGRIWFYKFTSLFSCRSLPRKAMRIMRIWKKHRIRKHLEFIFETQKLICGAVLWILCNMFSVNNFPIRQVRRTLSLHKAASHMLKIE